MTSYYDRLDNLFTAYAPEKRPLVRGLLEKYNGKEEEMINSLVKKFGPEPTSTRRPSSGRSGSPKNATKTTTPGSDGNSYRDRLLRLYNKYAPKKLPTVDATLSQFTGREEELFFALVKRYGPEPPGPDVAPPSPDSASDARSTLSTSTTSAAPRKYNVKDNRWRLARLFMQYAPEKLAIVDQMMETYAGREEEMIARCVERLGPEPPSPDTRPPRERLLRFLEHYMPHKMSTAEPMLEKYAARMDLLFATLVHKLGPEPPAPMPSSGKPKLSHRQRLIRFYKVYAREKLVNVESVLRRYKGNEEEMLRILVEKYGPEPDPDMDPDAPIPPERDFRARLTRLFTKYAPERVDSVPALLVKYKGSENHIIEALVKKLGPEPPLDALVYTLPPHTTSQYAADGSDQRSVGRSQREADAKYDQSSHKAGYESELGALLHHLQLPLSSYRKYAVVALGEEFVSTVEERFGIPKFKGETNDGESQWISKRVNYVAPLETSSTTDETTSPNAEATPARKEESHTPSEKMPFENWDPTKAKVVSANFSCLLLILHSVDFPIPASYDEPIVFRRYPLCLLLSERDRFTLRTAATLFELSAHLDTVVKDIWREEEVTRQHLTQRIHAHWEAHSIKREGKHEYMQRILSRALDVFSLFEHKERQEIESVEEIEYKGKCMWFHQVLKAMMMVADIDPLATKSARKMRRWKSLSATPSSPPAVRRSVSGSGLRSYMMPLAHDRALMNPPIGELLIDSIHKECGASVHGKRKTTLQQEIRTSPFRFTPTGRSSKQQKGMGLQSSTRGKSLFSPDPRNPNLSMEPINRELCFTEFISGFVGSRGSLVPQQNSKSTLDSLTHGMPILGPKGRDRWGPTRDGRISLLVPSPPRDAKEAIILGEMPPFSCTSYATRNETEHNVGTTAFFFDEEHYSI